MDSGETVSTKSDSEFRLRIQYPPQTQKQNARKKKGGLVERRIGKPTLLVVKAIMERCTVQREKAINQKSVNHP